MAPWECRNLFSRGRLAGRRIGYCRGRTVGSTLTQYFESTAWSVVAAANDSDSGVARVALEGLCRRYWPPLYSFLRYKGYPPDEAEELTQEFFSRLLDRDFLQKVDQHLGRFRSFLLASLENFLLDEHKLRRARKRGGTTAVFFSLDAADWEGQHDLPQSSAPDPRAAFDREWAETLMEISLLRLEREYRVAGKAHSFTLLKDCLVPSATPSDYGAIGRALGKTEGAVKVQVHRLRKRFGALVREELAQTVESEEQLKEELAYLIQVLGA